MATKLESLPDIFDNPIPFVNRAEQLIAKTDPHLQATFREWLLEQWGQINNLISDVPFAVEIRPHGNKPVRTIRTFFVPNGTFISELLPIQPVNTDETTGFRVDLKHVSGPLGLTPEWVGNYRFLAAFRVNQQRELRRTFVDCTLVDCSVVGDQKSKPFLRKIRLRIAMTPDINIRQLSAGKGF